MRKILLGYSCHPLELFMTWVTEVCCTEAEEHGHGAAVAALVLQEVSAMFGAHLGPGYVRAASADKLRWIEFIISTNSFITPGLTAIVCLTNTHNLCIQ